MKSILSFIWFSILMSNGSLLASDQIYQDELLEQLIMAEPGDTIEMKSGRFSINVQLSISTDNITLKGQGSESTILDFKNQQFGAEGLLITGNQIRLEGFTIENTKGDGIKAISVDGFFVKQVNVRWPGGLKTTNGAYGFYPVLSQRIIIEECLVEGASDAGIYVGQSRMILVKNNIVENNVAGIEIENSISADVFDNIVTKNSGGILVFNAPDLTIQGSRTRVFRNRIFENNTKNVAYPHNTVADVPTGTGLMILSNKKVEIYKNFLWKNNTAGILIFSYLHTGRPVQDPNFDPYPETLYIYQNNFKNNGSNPLGGASINSQKSIQLIRNVIGNHFPDIVFDGSINPANRNADGTMKSSARICYEPGDDFKAVNLDFPGNFNQLSFDKSLFACSQKFLPAVIISEE